MYNQLELDGCVHEAVACDENGCAGARIMAQALVAEVGTGHQPVASGRVLTCKPALLFFSPAWGREWGARALVVRRQSDVA